MRALKDIDIAFLPMPYTMDVDQPAVAEFKPAVVYPYHYKGNDPEAFAAKGGRGASEVGWCRASGTGKRRPGLPRAGRNEAVS
jgi:hypothetical protein